MPSRFMPRGSTHMLDFRSSPQSIDRPTMTVPSLATYSARVQAMAGVMLVARTAAATSAIKGVRNARLHVMTYLRWVKGRSIYLERTAESKCCHAKRGKLFMHWVVTSRCLGRLSCIVPTKSTVQAGITPASSSRRTE